MSCAGMPSVIAMTRSMPASAASRIDAAAKRGGTEGVEQPARDSVAARDPAEDVEQHGGDLLARGDYSAGVADRVGLGAAARVAEVGRRPARVRHDVERRHHEARAVAQDADVAVEL